MMTSKVLAATTVVEHLFQGRYMVRHFILNVLRCTNEIDRRLFIRQEATSKKITKSRNLMRSKVFKSLFFVIAKIFSYSTVEEAKSKGYFVDIDHEAANNVYNGGNLKETLFSVPETLTLKQLRTARERGFKSVDEANTQTLGDVKKRFPWLEVVINSACVVLEPCEPASKRRRQSNKNSSPFNFSFDIGWASLKKAFPRVPESVIRDNIPTERPKELYKRKKYVNLYDTAL